jgi:hypothetical protein
MRSYFIMSEKLRNIPIPNFFIKLIQNTIQLAINLIAFYLSNEITIDIWRTLTGH